MDTIAWIIIVVVCIVIIGVPFVIDKLKRGYGYIKGVEQ